MAIVFYVDGATKAVTTVQPSLEGGRVLIEVALPEGIPLPFLMSQLSSLNISLSSPANAATAAALVVKITYG